MSEPLAPLTVAPPPAPAEPAGGFFQNLIDVYFSPREAFTRIVRRPGFVLPAIGYLVLALGFSALWMHKLDAREYMKTQLEESGRLEKIPAEQREQVVEQSAEGMKKFGMIGPAVFIPIMVLAITGILMGIYRFFYAADVSFKQSLAIVCWTFFAMALVTTPLMLLVMNLKGDWNVDPQNVLQANLGLLVEKQSAKVLHAFLSSLDVFSFWMAFLLATGFAVASHKKTSAALWGVVVPWILIILIKVGWTAMF